MRKQLLVSSIMAILMAVTFFRTGETEAGGKKAALISHDVYFTLKDSSPAAQAKLVGACKKYLSKHPGEVFFAAGTRVKELDRPVNDQDFDVALHIVFRDKAAHDTYQDAPRHKQLIEENKENWKKVRVFDSVVQH